MAMIPAERQAAYRKRRRETDNGARRLDVMLSTEVFQALRRIALHGNETLETVLDRLVLAEDDRIGRGFDDEEFRAYGERALPGNRRP
jgi:hypothetical protein